MFGRNYQWILWGGHSKDWWLSEDPRVNCSSEQLIDALNGYMSTDFLPLSLDNETTIAHIVSV